MNIYTIKDMCTHDDASSVCDGGNHWTICDACGAEIYNGPCEEAGTWTVDGPGDEDSL